MYIMSQQVKKKLQETEEIEEYDIMQIKRVFFSLTINIETRLR